MFKKMFESLIDFEDKKSTPTTTTPNTPITPMSYFIPPVVNQELYTDLKKTIYDKSPELYKELFNCLEGLAAITTISIVQKYQAALTTLLNLKKGSTPSAIVDASATRISILESIKMEVNADFVNDGKKIESMVQEIEKTNKTIAELQLRRDDLTAKVAVTRQQLQKNELDFKTTCDQLSQELTSEHQLIQGIKT